MAPDLRRSGAERPQKSGQLPFSRRPIVLRSCLTDWLSWRKLPRLLRLPSLWGNDHRAGLAGRPPRTTCLGLGVPFGRSSCGALKRRSEWVPPRANLQVVAQHRRGGRVDEHETGHVELRLQYLDHAVGLRGLTTKARFSSSPHLRGSAARHRRVVGRRPGPRRSPCRS
jgi:hypothetical protein